MIEFRIIESKTYDEEKRILIPQYWVQGLKKKIPLDKWIDIKGFEDCEKAKQLLKALEE